MRKPSFFPLGSKMGRTGRRPVKNGGKRENRFPPFFFRRQLPQSHPRRTSQRPVVTIRHIGTRMRSRGVTMLRDSNPTPALRRANPAQTFLSSFRRSPCLCYRLSVIPSDRWSSCSAAVCCQAPAPPWPSDPPRPAMRARRRRTECGFPCSVRGRPSGFPRRRRRGTRGA